MIAAIFQLVDLGQLSVSLHGLAEQGTVSHEWPGAQRILEQRPPQLILLLTRNPVQILGQQALDFWDRVLQSDFFARDFLRAASAGDSPSVSLAAPFCILIPLGLLHPVAGDVQLQHYAVMHQPVDGRHGRHRISKM
jgi:hypothetical protein